MKRAWIIVLSGLFLAVAAYACVYVAGTSARRAVATSEQPALAWLQQEYQVSDAQFNHLREVHEAYRPKCMAMCCRIDSTNAQLRKLLEATNVITPEIKRTLAEAAGIRAECQAAMLAHFYQVAQTMPADQGKRYLEWVQGETIKLAPMAPRQAWATSTR